MKEYRVMSCFVTLHPCAKYKFTLCTDALCCFKALLPTYQATQTYTSVEHNVISWSLHKPPILCNMYIALGLWNFCCFPILKKKAVTINLLKPTGHVMHQQFNIQKFYMVLALRWVFSVDIRTDSDFCFIHHWLFGLYNSGWKCLLRGTNWFLI